MDTNSIIQQVIKQIEDCDNEKTTQNITAQKRTFYSTNELLAKQYTKRSKELPLLSNYNNNAESMRAGLWRIMDANNAKDFENFGPTKYVINLRALSNAHFANVDSKRMTSFNGILSTRNRNYMNYENSVLPSFAENTPCDRIIKMLEKSVKDVSSKDGYSNNFTSEPVIKNPVVRAMIKKAKVANSVPTILGKIDVVDLEGRRENQENDDQRAFSNLLKMCGLRHINHYDFNPRRSESIRISPEEFDLHVKTVMRQAEERYQRSLIKSPTTALPKDRDQERNFQMTDEFQMSNNKQHLFACNLNPQPRCSKINPWDSLMAIQQRGEDSVRKSYY